MTSPLAGPLFLHPSTSTLNSIYSTLAKREHARRHLAHHSTRTASPSRQPFSVRVGTQRDHLSCNRYGDIIAYDHSRILLPASSTSTRYVNASLILEPDLGIATTRARGEPRCWVAAQGPTSSTISAFLSLLLFPPTSLALEERSGSSTSRQLPLVDLIVQLTPLVEQNREKCSRYFPADVGDEWIFNDDDDDDHDDDGVTRSNDRRGVWVRLEGKEEADGARTSRLRVGHEGDETGRAVTHVEYLGWRDHGVPSSTSHLVSFIHRMNKLAASLAASSTSEPAPILLHCSAGVGRTGTYLSIASLLPFLAALRRTDSVARTPSFPAIPRPSGTTSRDDSLPDPYPSSSFFPNKDDGDHDDAARPDDDGPRAPVEDYVGYTIDRLRDQRTTMVQTAQQVEFVYRALRDAWTEGRLDE
ncbi:hypothetical protein JCM10212_004035 [Sporobolomyces blumeae]